MKREKIYYLILENLYIFPLPDDLNLKIKKVIINFYLKKIVIYTITKKKSTQYFIKILKEIK